MPDIRQSYSILRLYASGMKFVDDYNKDYAVDDYLDLHPEADRALVVAELQSELKRLEQEYHGRRARQT